MKIQIPTHFRFKSEEDASDWGSNTKVWHQIDEIKVTTNGYEIASTEFAWIGTDFDEPDLEFKFDPKNVKDELDEEDEEDED